ncbi:MAG: hypothetical protein WBQ34_02770 [Candidatus Acidiferrales bacterium]
MQSFLFMTLLVLPLVMNADVLRRLIRKAEDENVSPSRTKVAYCSLAASALAYATPFVLVIYNGAVGSGINVPGNKFLDGILFLKISVLLAVLSSALGLFAPRNVRLPLVGSGIVICLLWLSIPIAVL